MANNRGHGRRFGLLAGAAVAVAAMTGVAHAQQARLVTVSVQSQDLGDALNQLARQTNVQIVFRPELVRGKQAQMLSGNLTPQQALDRMLAGTDLTYRASGPDAYVILAQATQANPTQSGDADQAAPTEEIIVTAEKREERLVETPLSVSVLSSDALNRAGATQLRDFANSVPGLSFQSAGAGFNQITLRGVTLGQDTSPTVGIYVDDIPIGSSTGFAQAAQLGFDQGVFDVDHIEVLRGPQGTIYGASTMGGLIKYVSQTPDTHDFSGTLRTGLADTESGQLSYNGAFSLNAPIAADKAGLRVNGFYARDGGFIDNVALGRSDVNRSNIYGGRADLLLTPTDRLSVRISAISQNISRDGVGTADYNFDGTPESGALQQRRQIPEPFDQRFRLASGTVTYDFDNATLTSVSAYQIAKTTVDNDLTRTFVPLLSTFFGRDYLGVGVFQYLETEKVSQEIRLASNHGSTLDWLIGAFYTHENSENKQSLILQDLAGNPAPNDVFDYSGPTSYEEEAAFADLTFHVTPAFDITGGIRYAHNRQAFTQIGSGLLGASVPTQRSSEDVATYLLNGRYSLSHDSSVYFRYATGYRPGGPNFVSFDPTTGNSLGPTTFKSDSLASYEAGYKIQTRTFNFDIAAYHIDWSDIQLLTSGGGFSAYANGPGATIDGGELSLAAHVTPQLTLSGAFAYQNARLSGDTPTDVGGVKGERLPNVPQFTGALNADYVISNNEFTPRIGATVRYVGERDASFDAAQGFLQYHLPSYTAVDLNGSMTFGPVVTHVYVRNVFDERGQQSAITNAGIAQVAIIQPRTIGIELSTAF